MDDKTKHKILSYLDQALLFLWGILFLAFPFVISTSTTDLFIFPKQIFVSAVVLASCLLWALKLVLSKKLRFRRTPFDVPVILVGFALLVSSIFAVNKFDSLIAVTPMFLAILGYFFIVNTARKENTAVFLLSAILVSASALSLLAITSFFKVYLLPFPFTHSPSFSPLGSLFEQAILLAVILPISIHLARPMLKGDTSSRTVSYAASGAIIVAGLLVTVGQLLTTQKPVILPFETAFQTAFAAISQDTGRVALGFFFGHGFGTFAAVFTRFKQASFNSSPYWYVAFNQSSSLILELLATTGIVGILSFFLLFFRVLAKPTLKKINPVYFSLLLLILAMFVFPLSYVGLAFFFLLLGLFASIEALKHPSQFFDIEPKFVTLKKGLIALPQIAREAHESYEYSSAMPYASAVILLAFAAAVGLYAGKYVYADSLFQKSLLAAQSNNGSIAYTSQVQAINIFPYQSSYYRIFSQTNIALANSIANSQPKGSSPSANVQQTVYTLIQQGINTGRTATTLSPETVANWQNLSSVYRALIGIGQNADNFSLLAAQQAIILDPTNPQEYINLGGLYYQLSQWDNAIRQFQQAITLKQDYPNAYYNLAHAYEQKGDNTDALTALQTVKQLVVNDKANYDKVNQEINTLQNAGQNQQSQPPATQTQPSAQQPLNINGQQPQLPSQPTQIPVAGPTIKPAGPTSSPTPTK